MAEGSKTILLTKLGSFAMSSTNHPTSRTSPKKKKKIFSYISKAIIKKSPLSLLLQEYFSYFTIKLNEKKIIYL